MPLYIGSRLALLVPPPVAAVVLGSPAFINEAHNANTTVSLSVNKPASTVDGNLMVMVLWVDRTTSAITPPGGWNLINTQTFGSTLHNTYYKVASGEGASYSIGSSPSSFMAAGIASFSGTDTVSPLQTSSVNTNTSGTATGTGITTTNDNTLLVMTSATTGTRNYTASTLTERIDDGASIGLFSDMQTTAGASGNKTATISSSATWAAQLIAFKPSGGV